MAFFGVTREVIDTIKPIPGSDYLAAATLVGMDFQFAVMKGAWMPGDGCIYFPVDSLLPVHVQEKLGLVGKLSGKEKNRIKTIKLRGQISMGVVAKPELFDIPDGVDITTHLGVEKYEPPSVSCKAGRLLPLPSGLSKYDIEGADRYTHVFERLMHLPVIIMEKLEGQNVSFTLKVDGDEFFVNQRNFTIVPLEETGAKHSLWEYADKYGMKEILRKMVTSSPVKVERMITLYGEYVGPGVQGNIYKLPTNTVQFFDIKIDDVFVNVDVFFTLCKIGGTQVSCDIAPIIEYNVPLKEILNGKTTQEFSHGPSILNKNVLREGVVYKPIIEQYDEKIGRLILKTRDPIYLSKSEF